MGKLSIIIFLITSVLLLTQCKNGGTTDIKKITADYYQTYKVRTDTELFMSFYSEEIYFEDVINKTTLNSKEQLLGFFDWTNPSFQKVGEYALEITDQHIADLTVTTSGLLNAFTWDGQFYEAMKFTSILTFNSQGKIVHQVDWINYPEILRR